MWKEHNKNMASIMQMKRALDPMIRRPFAWTKVR